jgi:hypothetical protein
MVPDTYTATFLKFYTETIIKDIEELKAVAENGEKEYLENMLATQLVDLEHPTTVKPPLTFLDYQIEVQPSRCTIPLAMLCLAVGEGIGNLLGAGNDFMNRINAFFHYADVETTHEERDLLRGLYRNGVMHTYLPKGDLGITYDSSLDLVTKLFLEQGRNTVILNVNYLCRITESVLDRILDDEAVKVTVTQNLGRIIEEQEAEANRLVTAYKNSQAR